jgi:hypothetical protein
LFAFTHINDLTAQGELIIMHVIQRYSALGVAILAALLIYGFATFTRAADLGGNCCADLEERIAELEATAAKKGNRKVSLEVYGQINAQLLYIDVDGYNRTKATQNGTDQTFIGFAGSGKINADASAGFKLELAFHQLGLGDTKASDELRVQQSYVYLESASLGKVSLGKIGQATRDIDKISTANTQVVSKPLSIGGLSDAFLTGVDLPFDGVYIDGVRYDSPLFAHFVLSASWGSSMDLTGGQTSTYDIALRYANEISGFRLAGGAGYRHSTDYTVNVLNMLNFTLPTGDVNTFDTQASIMHIGTGLFVTGSYAHQDWKDANFTLQGWQVQGGLETKLVSFGRSTFYAEYGQIDFSPAKGGVNVPLWGLGAVQAIDAAAADVYIGYRNYDLGELGVGTAQSVSGGMRIKF